MRKGLEGERDTRSVHCDLCGPMRTTTILGARYFLLFIDHYSKKMWVHFLKKKSDAFIEFQHFKVAVEDEIFRRIKNLHSDNSNEFTSTAFESFCKKE